MSSGPPPVPVLVAALLVLLGGVAAVVTHHDHTSSTPSVSSARPSSTTSSSSSASLTTRTTSLPSSSSPTSGVSTSVRPAVSSPEAAANGLWAAYTASNRTAAQRFATDDVIRVLFEVEYSGEQGTFQSCRSQADHFDCQYSQPSTQYKMTVRADSAGSYRVVEITVTSGS